MNMRCNSARADARTSAVRATFCSPQTQDPNPPINNSSTSVFHIEFADARGPQMTTPDPTVAAGATAPSDTIRAAGTLDLTVHALDPNAKANTREATRIDARYRISGGQREYDGDWGATICGKRLDYAELWCHYQPEPCDTLCPRCFT